jgi:hypothetical protein
MNYTGGRGGEESIPGEEGGAYVHVFLSYLIFTENKSVQQLPQHTANR